MSASMYNSPYAYKEPPPRIEYPPMFAGLSGMINLKHVLDSKLLAIALILFGVSMLVGLICVFSPFWFKLVFSPQDGTFGTEDVKMELSIDTGLFFINADEMDNLMDLNEASNHDVVPTFLVAAQLLEVLGMCLLAICLFSTLILVFRKLASVTGNFILAFFSSVAGLSLLVAFVSALITSLMSSCDPYGGDKCNYKDNLKWRIIPMYSQIYRIEPLVTPYVKLNWTFYISIIGAVLAICGSVCVWLEALSAYRKLSQIRYMQLRAARDPHEGDINPVDHGKYVYRPPIQEGPLSYGMQPVSFQAGPYGMQPGPYGAQPGPYGMPTAPYRDEEPPKTRFGVGFEDRENRRAPSDSSPPPSRRRGSPPPRRRSPSPSPSPPPSPRSGLRHSPPSSRRRSPPPKYSGQRSPSPPERGVPRRGGPPSVNSSVSEGPYISREIDL